MIIRPNRHALIFMEGVSVDNLIDWLLTLPSEATNGTITSFGGQLKVSWSEEEEDKT